MSRNPQSSREDRGGWFGQERRRAARLQKRKPTIESLEGRQLMAVAPVIGSLFPIPTANSGAAGIALGPDGNLWFTEGAADQIAKSTPAGQITQYALPTADANPKEIVSGPGNSLWFTEEGAGKIGKIDPNGNVTEYSLPTAGSSPSGITLGPDGNIWFTELSSDIVGKITPQGVVTEYILPTANAGPLNITAGGDGNLWFTENSADQIGRISPSTGTVVEFPATNFVAPDAITLGADGALWFTQDDTAAIGRITTAGVATTFAIPSGDSGGAGIATGPNGAIYFTEPSGAIGEVGNDGVVSESFVGVGSSPFGLTFGANNYLYFTDQGTNTLGVADLQIPSLEGYQVFGSAGGLGQIVLQFGGALSPQSADDLANYTLSTPGNKSGTFDTATQIFAGKATDRYLHLKSAVYNASNNTVVLTTSKPLTRRGSYRLRLSGESPSGIAGPSGNPLLGNGAVTPGSFLDLYFRGFTKSNSVPSSGLSTLSLTKGGAHHRR